MAIGEVFGVGAILVIILAFALALGSRKPKRPMTAAEQMGYEQEIGRLKAQQEVGLQIRNQRFQSKNPFPFDEGNGSLRRNLF